MEESIEVLGDVAQITLMICSKIVFLSVLVLRMRDNQIRLT